MVSATQLMALGFSGTAVIILLITVVLSLSVGTQVGGNKAIIYDKKIIGAMNNISSKVPFYEGIITPNFTPIVMYFTDRMVYTPYSADSYSSLLNVMNKKNYTYLLVFENQSDITGLMGIFKKERLPNLSKNFSEMAIYNTDFSKLHLYKRN